MSNRARAKWLRKALDLRPELYLHGLTDERLEVFRTLMLDRRANRRSDGGRCLGGTPLQLLDAALLLV